MSDAETLKRLIRLWAILEGVSPKMMMTLVMRELKIKSFTDDENAQKLAITYLRHKFDTKEDD